MKSTRVLAVVASALLVAGATTAGWAQQPAPQAGQPEKPAAEKAAPAKPGVKATRVTGSVKSVSADSLVVEVPQKDKSMKEYTFALDLKAQLSKAGKKIAPGDLQAGDRATVSFREAEGKLVATAVSVRAKAAK